MDKKIEQKDKEKKSNPADNYEISFFRLLSYSTN